MPQTATTPTVADPATARRDAELEVERVSKKRHKLRAEGTAVAPERHAEADAELAAAGQRLGAAELAEQRSRHQPAFDTEKFYRQRTKTFDLHESVLNRLSEHTAARGARNGLISTIAALERSDDFRILQRNLARVGVGEEMSPDAVKTGHHHAALHEQLATAEISLVRASAALTAAKTRWEAEKAVLDVWTEAIRKMPGGERLLGQIPQPHQRNDAQADHTGVATLEIGPHAMPRAAPASPHTPAPVPAQAAAAARPGLRTSASVWARANARTSAQHGVGDAANAFDPTPLSTVKLIETVNEPGHLEALAARSAQLTDAERDAALRAFSPPKEPPRAAVSKARKAAKPRPAPKASEPKPAPAAKVEPPAPRKMGLSIFKFRRGSP